MKADMRKYRRDLALYCLTSAPARKGIGAGDLVELMGVTAQQHGHDTACWKGLNAPEVSGICRALVHAGLAVVTGAQKNTRSSREEPLWALKPEHASSTVGRQLPEPPELGQAINDRHDRVSSVASTVPAAAPAIGVYDALDRQQLLAVLYAQDELLVETARFMERMAGARMRAIDTLRRAGVMS